MKPFHFKFLSLFLALSLMVGCGDDNPSSPEPEPDCRIVQYEVNGSLRTIEYNDRGNIQSVTYASSGDVKIYEYEYIGDNVKRIEHLGDSASRTWMINADGLLANFRREDDDGYWRNIDFEYEGEQMLKSTQTKSNTNYVRELIYVWENGNVAEITLEGNTQLEYDYYDIPVQQGDYFKFTDLLNQGFSNSMLRNTNLIKSADFGGGEVINIDYEFGEDGKITKMIVTDSSGTSEYNYTYECN